MTSPDQFIAELWEYANQVPMVEHPWFKGIVDHRWTREQIVLGEVQHYLRVRTNPIYFGYMAVNAVANREQGLADVVLENFMEELSGDRSHVDIMYQFLEEAGISREEADNAEPTPGTLAAIEMIIGCCQRRSALEGVAMLALVESQHGGPGRRGRAGLQGARGTLRVLGAAGGNVPYPRRAGRGARRPADRHPAPRGARRRGNQCEKILPRRQGWASPPSPWSGTATSRP